MRSRFSLPLLAALVGLASASLNAQIASFNFDGDTTNSTTPTGFTQGFTVVNLTTPGGALSAPGNASGAVVLAGNANTLGSGNSSVFNTTDNKFLRFYDNGTGNLSLRNTTALANKPVSMMSFDFINTQYPTGTGSQVSGLFIAISANGTAQANSAASITNAARIELFRGNSTSGNVSVTNSTAATGGLTSGAVSGLNFTLNTVNTFRLIVNDLPTSFSYSSGSISGTLNANTYAVWINDTLFTNNRAMRSNHTSGNDSYTSFALGTTNGTGVDWAIDNFLITEIPEPSSFAALAGACALGMVALRRRRRLS